MDAVFLKLLNLSIEAGWLVLAVVVLRFVLGKTRAPKYVRCLMWALVGLRLVIPFSVESILSLVPSREVLTMDTVRYAAAPTVNTGVQLFDDAVNPGFSRTFAPEPGASVNPLHALTYIAGWVWLAGLAVMAGYFAISALLLKRRVRDGAEVEKGVRESVSVPSPFVFGIRPVVYLPAGMDPASREYVLAHERAHIRRRDYLIKPFAFLVLAVYWFNPLMWLAYVLLCRDIELACDEKVLSELGAAAKKPYSQALLSAVTFHRRVAACPVAFGEGKLTRRIRNVLSWKKPVLWITVAALLACAVLAVCFLTDPDTPGEGTTYVYSDGYGRVPGTPLTLVLCEDGTYTYTESGAYAFTGSGTWTEESGTVTLKDRSTGDTVVFRRYPYEEAQYADLQYIAGESSNSRYVRALDNGWFRNQTENPNDDFLVSNMIPPTNATFTCTVTAVSDGGGRLGTCELVIEAMDFGLHTPAEELILANGARVELAVGTTLTTDYTWRQDEPLEPGRRVTFSLSYWDVPALSDRLILETAETLSADGFDPDAYARELSGKLGVPVDQTKLPDRNVWFFLPDFADSRMTSSLYAADLDRGISSECHLSLPSDMFPYGSFESVSPHSVYYDEGTRLCIVLKLTTGSNGPFYVVFGHTWNGATGTHDFDYLGLTDAPTDYGEKMPEPEIPDGVLNAGAFSWAEESARYLARGLGVKTRGFSNNAPEPVGTYEEAAERALAEVTVEYDEVWVYFDESAGMYRVNFQLKDAMYIDEVVFLGTDGVTRLAVYGDIGARTDD